MRKAASKSLYLFLCAILGMILFAMLHRSIFVLYDLLLFLDTNTFSLGLNSVAIQALDFSALLVALFVGGWYGTMMGIEWYAMVYGPNAEHPAGMFHGFIPHNWRGRREKKLSRPTKSVSAPAPLAAAPETTSTTVKVPVVERIRETASETLREAVRPVREWTFDDLIPPKSAPKKRAVRKTAAKKQTTRKTAARKTTKA